MDVAHIAWFRGRVSGSPPAKTRSACCWSMPAAFLRQPPKSFGFGRPGGVVSQRRSIHRSISGQSPRLGRRVFTPDPATASRLAMLSRNVFRAEPGPLLLTLATYWANSRHSTSPLDWSGAAGPPIASDAPSPRAESRRAVQADSFTQGGMEQVVIDLARCLHSENFDASLLILEENKGQTRRRGGAGRIPVLSLPREGRDVHYRRLLREQRIDVVNAHYSLYGAAIAAEMQIPFVQTIHNTYIFLPPKGVAAYYANDPFTSAYVCVSQWRPIIPRSSSACPCRKWLWCPTASTSAGARRHGPRRSGRRCGTSWGSWPAISCS